MEFNFTEIIGYLGSLGILLSFAMKDMKKLRIINTIGCAIFVLYGYLLHYSFPIIVTNLAIMCLNIYYLSQKPQSDLPDSDTK
jgi:O-antigen/teichoic acid export membrane protein